jgi:N-acetylneuraminic acid mutarotase
MKLYRKTSLFVLLILLLNVALPIQVSHAAPALSFDRRLSYQRALDAVTWQHTVFPSVGNKPPLSEVIPAEITQRKVEDALRQSNALSVLWSRPLTAEQLQAEMQRIAQQTKQPDLLREQWRALDNDPRLIAELQVRPLLADRLLRNWYGRDERFHGDLKSRVQSDLALFTTAASMQQMSGEYVEFELIRDTGGQHDPGVITLSPEEWDEQTAALANTFGSPSSELPLQRLSTLQEDNSRFYVNAVLSQTDNSLRLVTVQWNKVPFETWWASVRDQYTPSVASANFEYVLPQIGSTCTNDCWSYLSFAPMGRAGQVGVWTGTDMLIWGGLLFHPETGGRYNPATDSWHPFSNANVPSWRSGHNLVWTGTELIVWGGWGGSFVDNVFNTGGRYNPQTDTWTATSLTNAPTPRTEASAVWTGSEMIVWGGGDAGFTRLNTGGRYNPSTNSWSSTSLTNAPSPRSGHGGVWTGTEMIVWGGSSGTGQTNTGARYNPGTNSWITISTVGAPDARISFSTVWSGTEMIVWAGRNSNFTQLNTGGRYNPVTNSWSATNMTGAPSARRAHSAVWTGSEMIVFGGCTNHDCSSQAGDGFRYNPTANTWTAISSVNAPRSRASVTALWTGTEMIIWGGCFGGECQIKTNTGGRYNPSSNSWVATGLPPVPFQRQPFVSAWTGTEMLVWGVDSQLLDTSIYRYAPATDSWARTVSLNAPDARGSFSGVWTGTELIIWGGGVTGFGPSLTGGRFNPSTNTWTETSWTNAPSAREWHSAVWTGSEMIVWGGCLDGSCGATLNNGARYNPANDSWTAISTTGAPSGRYTHSAVWTGSEMIIWGGQPATNTGARYNPATNTWTAMNLSGAPSARWAHAGMWTGSEFLVWGGYNGTTAFNNGGRYKPSTNSWSPITSTSAPSARWHFPAVWSGSELVLWGGIVNASWPFISTNTGARYNPATNSWTSTTLQSAPSARDLQQSVWTGSQMIVWGGTMDPDGVNTNSGAMYWANSEGGGLPTLPTLAALQLNPTTVMGGQTSQATLTLSGPAPSGGAVVMLSSSNSAASVPASVTVPEGAISANFTVSTTSVASATSVTIGASYNNSNVIATLWIGASPPTPITTPTPTSISKSTLTPTSTPTTPPTAGSTPTRTPTSTPSLLPVLRLFTLNPTSVRGGLNSTGTVTLSAPAPEGGAVITLVSSNPNVATVPASIIIPASATSASFTVITSRVTRLTSVVISATYNNTSVSATLNVTRK